ncbi:hypothetical protein PFUGPA_00215 [Plasmodium falciparum Palo Alto/Uganda]|uniref:Uncharacterized protein n=2 Tax=Plasmodium falciparum TaxID=5833 RepID=W4J675_PLAFP|nr:hypothetical protein PFTANZ_06069 [Plasmodium falciparum Tanzania (2000708)]ETW57765.1 hypothetical protein PFUGPA_00215 [Plasmodium falciparum Palo Alto/Uganda]
MSELKKRRHKPSNIIIITLNIIPKYDLKNKIIETKMMRCNSYILYYYICKFKHLEIFDFIKNLPLYIIYGCTRKSKIIRI